ncbi:MAG: aminopeptidase P family protein [Bacteroidales bacterium]|nr:aminopeptidase P family protein [Bacteroidales bacterium]
MFQKEIYKNRRASLMREVGGGIIVLPANRELPFNYISNTLPFRQDSTFLYYVGIDMPGLVAVLDCDSGQEYLYGEQLTMDDIIWTGELPSVSDLAAMSGIGNACLMGNMGEYFDNLGHRELHYLKPYQSDVAVFLSDLLGISLDSVLSGQSDRLARAVIGMRRTKQDIEIAEIEKAVDATRMMHNAAMAKVAGGDFLGERDVYAAISEVAMSKGYYHSFPPIVTVHGEVFHNHGYRDTLKHGQLLLVDAGAESLEHYAGDMTRTFPVGGKFSTRQKDIYDIVQKANECVALSARPGISWSDMHDRAAGVIASGLKDLGLMRGDTDDIVASGAYALFFPHGLGHLMGLDVHDMENIGEDLVGYSDKQKRSTLFGKNCLRYGLPLERNMVITDEPGIYFIPQLIDKWRADGLFANFIDYQRVEKYKNFGGIRIEDDLLITENGCRILGTVPLPKKSDEVECFFCN